MSSHSEPLVETLTAEVRVLRVGSKPVTLSAARQLDHAVPADIKPFGRVRIDPNPGRIIEVIGSADGTLARSSASAGERTCPGYSNEGTFYRESVCPDHLSTLQADGTGQHKWTKYYPVAGAIRGMARAAPDHSRGAPLAAGRLSWVCKTIVYRTRVVIMGGPS